MRRKIISMLMAAVMTLSTANVPVLASEMTMRQVGIEKVSEEIDVLSQGRKIEEQDIDAEDMVNAASTEYASGECGDNLTWEYEDEVLTIGGTGNMWDYEYGAVPWNDYMFAITQLELEDGITSIGDSAFWFFYISGELMIPEGVTNIGQFAFAYCGDLEGDLVFPKSLRTIENGAFKECTGFSGNVVIQESVTDIGHSAFYNCTGVESIIFKGSKPEFGLEVFQNVIADVYYPADDSSWTGIEVQSSLGGTLNWIPYEGDFTETISGTCGNNLYWELEEGILTITGTGAMYSYGATKSPWYEYRDEITELVLHEGITSIGSEAFKECGSISGDLILPDSLVSIGESAFYGCSGFSGELLIPEGVTSIGNSAFSDCTGFTGDLILPDGITSIGGWVFTRCSGFDGELIIPDGVISIGKCAFRNCSSLGGELIIPSSVTSIGDMAFENCSNFSGSLNIPSGVTSIGDSVFENCSGLDGELVLPERLTYIGDDAFNGCIGFSGDLIIPERVTSIGNYAFYNCTKLTSIVLPGSVSAIGKDAFTNSGITFETTDSVKYLTLANNTTFVIIYANRSITSITWPSDVVGVAGGAFASCTSLTSVEIPSTILNINEYTFNGCTKLVSVEIPSSITEISNYAFAGCSQLASVTFANESQLTTIGDYAFQNCTALISILIPSNVVNIKDYAFSGCNQLTSIDFSANSKLEVLGNYVFQNCSKLTSINFANVNKLTTIGNYAFGSCSILPTIIIPSSVESIGEYAFYSCYKLDSVDFANDSKLTTIAQRVFAYCNVLTSVVIPRGLTTISEYAFNGCSKLATIKYMGTPNEFELIVVGANNTDFTSAKVVYYYGWNVTSRIDPTCTADGFEAYEKDGETGQIVLPMIPHDYEDAVCSICGKEAVTIVTEISEGTYGFINSDGIYTSNNKGKGSTNAYATITAMKACEIVITWTVSSQANYDKFYIYVNNTVQSTVNGVSGIKNGTLTLTLAVGDVVKLRYYKNSSTNSNNDCATFTYIETEITE